MFLDNRLFINSDFNTHLYIESSSYYKQIIYFFLNTQYRIIDNYIGYY